MHVMQGAVVGAGLGAAAAWCFMQTQEEAGEDSEDRESSQQRAIAVVEEYRNLCKHGHMATLAFEASPTFLRVDEEAARQVLQSLDDLARLLVAARSNSVRSSVIAEALKARRAGSAALAALTRGARRHTPSQAAELSETFESLQRIIHDSVHNIQQETSLSLMRPRD